MSWDETIETFLSFYVKCHKLNNRTYVPTEEGGGLIQDHKMSTRISMRL